MQSHGAASGPTTSDIETLLSNTDDWYPRLAAATAHLDGDLAALRSAVSDIAWRARERCIPVTPVPETSTGHELLAARYYVGQRLRYDFRFRELARVTEPWLSTGDSLILAMAAFARFGQLEMSRGRSLVERATQAADADTKTRHLCIHALSLSQDTADHQLVLELSQHLLDLGDGGPNAHFRRAIALRHLGRYDEALGEIDGAIERHGTDNNVHQDYVRERELILATAGTAAVAAATLTRIEELEHRFTVAGKEQAERIDARLGKAEGLVTDGLFRTIEILGLFLALTGFVVGSSTAAVKSPDWWHLVVAMCLLVAGTALFLAMMRWVVTRPLSGPETDADSHLRVSTGPGVAING